MSFRIAIAGGLRMIRLDRLAESVREHVSLMVIWTASAYSSGCRGRTVLVGCTGRDLIGVTTREVLYAASYLLPGPLTTIPPRIRGEPVSIQPGAIADR